MRGAFTEDGREQEVQSNERLFAVPDDEKLLTVNDIAGLTQSSRWFVRDQIRHGHLRIRVLRPLSPCFRITQADYNAWLMGEEVSSS